MKNCSECNTESPVLMRSGLVENEVCKTCYDKLAAFAIQKACNPAGDKNPLEKTAVTTKTVEAAVIEDVS